MGELDVRREWLKCQLSCKYFIDTYVPIYDATAAAWIPFKLWQAQRETVDALSTYPLNIILKARQLGLTWLVLAYALWKMLLHPAATVTVFSRRDDEAQYLLDFRLRGMYKRLPRWMHVKKILTSNQHIWQLSNGSIAYGFPTTAGDSYTVSLAIVDEADLVPDLSRLMNAVKPTIDGGGEMILLSRSNKDDPSSPFKQMYRAAREGASPWHAVFLPWDVRTGRTKLWYEDQRKDILARTGSLDDLHQQYPTTDEEALAPRVMDKRIPPAWLEQIYVKMKPMEDPMLVLPDLYVYRYPEWGHRYAIGADPAEGNPTSDNSSAHVIEFATGEEVARLSGKIQPTAFAEYIATLSNWYNGAVVLVERNNHGHAVIAQLTEAHMDVELLAGPDGAVGWLSNSKGKALLWTTMTDAAKDKTACIHSEKTYVQLTSIEGATLRAPKGANDDEAVSYALAIRAASGEDATSFVMDYTEEGAYAVQTKQVW